MISGVYARAVPEQAQHASTMAGIAVRKAAHLPELLRQSTGAGSGMGYLEIVRTEGGCRIRLQHLNAFSPAYEPCINLRGQTRKIATIRQLGGAWLPEEPGDLLGLVLASPDTDGDLDFVEIFMSSDQCIQLIVDRAEKVCYIESDADVEGFTLDRHVPDLYFEGARHDNGLWWLSHHLRVTTGAIELFGNVDFGDDIDGLKEDQS